MKTRNRIESQVIIKDIGLGLCGTLVDISLFFVCFGLGYALSGMSSYKGRVNLKPLEMMLDTYPSWRSRLRNALHLAKRDGYISEVAVKQENKSTNASEPQLSKKGIDRLYSLLPRIKRHPVWSGSIWLVTYDIAEDRKKDREILRKFLVDQGYGKLQDSVYVSAFDPTELVKTAVNNLSIQGEVIISRMGESGHIGNMTLSELIASLYPIQSVESSYQQYINTFDKDILPAQASFILLNYLSILKIDPQLPKEMLPDDWPGEKAYELTQAYVVPLLIQHQPSSIEIIQHIL